MGVVSDTIRSSAESWKMLHNLRYVGINLTAFKMLAVSYMSALLLGSLETHSSPSLHRGCSSSLSVIEQHLNSLEVFPAISLE